MSRFESLIAGLRQIGSERGQLARELEQARRELEDIDAQPMNRTDALTMLTAYVDSTRSRFVENLARSLKVACAPGNKQLPNYTQHGFPLLRSPVGMADQIDQTLLVAALAEPLKQMLAEAVQQVEWPGCDSQCFAEREKRKSVLKTKIDGLTERIAEIDQVAAQGRFST